MNDFENKNRDCSTPNDTETCKGPCVEKKNCKSASTDKAIFAAPEGITVSTENDQSKALSEMVSKKLSEYTNTGSSYTNSTSIIDANNCVDVELPNGMSIKVSKQTYVDRHRAAVEIDCDIEDEEGNLKVDHTDDGPAESAYKAGALRDLKRKFYPNDTSGVDAQARLKDKATSEDVMRERCKKRERETELVASPDRAYYVKAMNTMNRLQRERGLTSVTEKECEIRKDVSNNPNLLRRSIRSVRRVLHSLSVAKSRLICWWRL